MSDISLKKLLPHNLEAEISVLGAVLQKNEVLAKISKIIAPDDFYNGSNSKIFSTMQEISENRGVIDLVTLSEALDQRGELKKIGGSPYLMDLMGSTPTSTTATHHAKIIHEKASLRRLITVITKINNEAYEGHTKPKELMQQVQTGIKDIADNIKSRSAQQIFELKHFEEQLDQFSEGKNIQGEYPGWYSLSRFYTVRPGEWTLVTGIPSHGKSEFVDALMINLAANSDWRFAVYSPENYPLERHASKLIEKLSGYPCGSGHKEKISPETLKYCKGFIQDHFRFIFPDDENHKVDSILNLAEELVETFGIKGLVVDPYNELDHSRPAKMTETEYISQCLTRVRRFARTHNIHIWVVAHPTKLQKDKDGNYPVPTPYDVSGSAHWRNKADNAIAVWRNTQNQNEPVQIYIQKIRFKDTGKQGMVELRYDYVSGRYSDL